MQVGVDPVGPGRVENRLPRPPAGRLLADAADVEGMGGGRSPPRHPVPNGGGDRVPVERPRAARRRQPSSRPGRGGSPGTQAGGRGNSHVGVRRRGRCRRNVDAGRLGTGCRRSTAAIARLSEPKSLGEKSAPRDAEPARPSGCPGPGGLPTRPRQARGSRAPAAGRDPPPGSRRQQPRRWNCRAIHRPGREGWPRRPRDRPGPAPPPSRSSPGHPGPQLARDAAGRPAVYRRLVEGHHEPVEAGGEIVGEGAEQRAERAARVSPVDVKSDRIAARSPAGGRRPRRRRAGWPCRTACTRSPRDRGRPSCPAPRGMSPPGRPAAGRSGRAPTAPARRRPPPRESGGRWQPPGCGPHARRVKLSDGANGSCTCTRSKSAPSISFSRREVTSTGKPQVGHAPVEPHREAEAHGDDRDRVLGAPAARCRPEEGAGVGRRLRRW